jgi:hypothetical protein
MSTWTEGDTESETSDRSERRDGSLDTATLNRLSIRRFTESTLTGYGGSVDRKEADRWEVTVPGSLINVAEGGHATLVFDPKDQEPGAKDILVRPGTPFFNALVDLARQERSVGHVHLGASELQLTVPPALKAGSLDASVTGFDVSSTELTVAFHFLVELEIFDRVGLIRILRELDSLGAVRVTAFRHDFVANPTGMVLIGRARDMRLYGRRRTLKVLAEGASGIPLTLV